MIMNKKRQVYTRLFGYLFMLL